MATGFMRVHIGWPLRLGASGRVTDCDWKILERAFLSVSGSASEQVVTVARLWMAMGRHQATPEVHRVTADTGLLDRLARSG